MHGGDDDRLRGRRSPTPPDRVSAGVAGVAGLTCFLGGVGVVAARPGQFTLQQNAVGELVVGRRHHRVARELQLDVPR